jgi:hypothetical protein
VKRKVAVGPPEEGSTASRALAGHVVRGIIGLLLPEVDEELAWEVLRVVPPDIGE